MHTTCLGPVNAVVDGKSGSRETDKTASERVLTEPPVPPWPWPLRLALSVCVPAQQP